MSARPGAIQIWTDFEVMICENGGETAFEELRGAAPDRLAGGQPVRIYNAGANLGFAGGVNRCLAETAVADRLVDSKSRYSNPSTKPSSGW